MPEAVTTTMQALPCILKPAQAVMAANLPDYEAGRLAFSWDAERQRLAVLQSGGLNMAFEALDRQVLAGRRSQCAVRFIDREGKAEALSFDELQRCASRFAQVLTQLGVARGMRVCSLLGRGPELHAAALGTLKAGAVFCPLFSAFGPEPIQTRLELAGAVVLVTTDLLYARKVASLRERLPALKHILLVRSSEAALPADTLDLAALLAAAPDRFETVQTRPEEGALLHFTSGTTGKPKGVLHHHAAVLAQQASARFALDLRDTDRYWCTADPGWVTGLVYGVLAPLYCGATAIVDREEFDPERWCALLERERVSVWYTAPTAIRMLMKAGAVLVKRHHYPALRFMASVGEPLNPEAVVWGIEAFGLPFHDNWWQTETGAIMVANFASQSIKPGSMGRPLPGIDAAVVLRRDHGVEVLTEPDAVGELAIRAGWPSMFVAYLDQEEKYRSCFVDGWYLSGDLARRDAEGYFWFVGRGDDVIKSAGHLISPFEIESALMRHPAVAQVGVIGVPDPVVGHFVKAFVELRAGFTDDDALRQGLLAHARRQLGPALAPREIVVVPMLPRTRSGKVMRRLLRARELGLPEGDLSTLEVGA